LSGILGAPAWVDFPHGGMTMAVPPHASLPKAATPFIPRILPFAAKYASSSPPR